MQNDEAIVATKAVDEPASAGSDDDLTWNPKASHRVAEDTNDAGASGASAEAGPATPDETANSATNPASELPARSRSATKTQTKSKTPLWLIGAKPPKWSEQWFDWMVYRALKGYNYSFIPVPNFWGSYRQRIAENHAFVREESDYSMAIIAVVSVKGGGAKTTTTTWDGAEDSELTSGLTLIIDADSSGVQSANERLSILEKPDSEFFLTTPQVAEKILLRGWVPTAEQVTYFTAKHSASRVRVLAMDTSDIGREAMERVLKALKPAVHTIYVDTTPGLKEKNTYGAIDAATLVVVSTLYDNTSAIRAAKQTLHTEEYGLQERLERGDDVILAIHGVEPKDFNPRFQYEQADEFGLKPHQVSLFPKEGHASKARPVDRSMVSERYLFALSEHRRRCAEAAIRWNEKYPLNPLPGDEEEGQPAADASGNPTIRKEA